MNILELIKKLKEYSSEVDDRVGELKIPASIKNKFLDAWKAGNRNATLVTDQIRISNQGPPTYALTDELLAKCAKAVDLYKEYDRLAALIEEQVTDSDILNKIGAENTSLSTDQINGITNKLEAVPGLTPDIKWLKMMLEPKSNRSTDGHIGPFKQITRPDRWQPALSKFIGTLAADAYPNTITFFLLAHPEIATAIQEKTNLQSLPKKSNNIQIPPGELERNVTFSLLSKPFIILTGSSGTGKTLLARNIANYFSKSDRSNVTEVAVGADWTDNRNVVGFVNHLRSIDGKPVYQSTPALDLILRADTDPDTPHFLILDEMNLSHVERYFSDFLSAMEMKDGKLQLHGEGDLKLPRHEGDLEGVAPCIDYPENLFVIGTVNIDETTYMFSPKVLDRANVIEFKVEDTEIRKYLENPVVPAPVSAADAGVAEGYLNLALEVRNGDIGQLSTEVAESVNNHLVSLFNILKDGRFEFAFRTAKEINHYLRVCAHLAPDKNAWEADGWKTDLDKQILQKLLPKLHGSMGRISSLLADLADYCHSGTRAEAPEGGQTRARLDSAAGLDPKTAVFPSSLGKLQSMIATLKDEQFVSFIQ